MATIEVHFPMLGSEIPTDHAYALYSVLSHCIKEFHAEDGRFQIGPVYGQHLGKGKLQLDTRRSFLRLRLPAQDIPTVLPLAGQPLDVGGHKVRLGVPQLRSLIPAPALIARLVTIKKSKRHDKQVNRECMEPAAFLAAARRKLDEMGIEGEAAIPLIRSGDRTGQPCRRVLRIHDRCIVGFTLEVTGLTADESVRLQEHGLGGRKKMGCGFFVPLQPR